MSSSIHSSIGEKSPITPLRKNPRQLLQILPINLIKPLLLRTININNRNSLHTPQVSSSPTHSNPRKRKTHLPTNQNRHNNLAPTLRITRNMARERHHIVNNNCFSLRSCGPAHAAPEVD